MKPKQSFDLVSIYGYFCFFLLGIYCISLFSSLPLEEYFYLKVLFSFAFKSLFISVIGAIYFVLSRNSFQKASYGDKIKKTKRYFLVMAVIGIITIFPINISANLAQLDCYPSCGPGAEVGAWALKFYFPIWVIIPLVLWWRARMLQKM